ncbi:MAG TPA: DUF5324 family protein [Actinopolymorphaceae bacterium]|nr:DUF5324 family protein [Actinopolymorphaceae bacterium]
MHAADHARDRMGPAMDNARQRIGPAVDDAREKVGPAVEHARTVIVDDVVPKVTTAMSTAVTASKPYRTEAKRRGSAAFAALRGEVDVPHAKRKRRWPRLLLGLAAMGGAAVAVYRLLKRGTAHQWQPMHSTTAPTQHGRTSAAQTDAPGGRPDATADEAGAEPGEALADRTNPPTGRTTPEDPAEHTETPAAGAARSEGGPVPQQPYGRERSTSEESKKRPSRSGPTARNTGPRGRPRSS